MSDAEGNIRPNLKVHRVFWYHFKDRRVFTEAHPFVSSKGEPEIGKRLAIEYSPGGEASNLAKIMGFYDDLRPETDESVGKSRINDPHSAVGTMKRVTWEIMDKYFEAFLKGEQVAVIGTPIGALPAIDTSHINIFRDFGLTTVEGLLEAPESIIISLAARLPDIRRWLDIAKKFMAAKSVAETQSKMEAKDNEIDSLKGEVNELKAMMQQLIDAQIAKASEDQPKRKGGRPSNAEIEARRAAEAQAEAEAA